MGKKWKIWFTWLSLYSLLFSSHRYNSDNQGALTTRGMILIKRLSKESNCALGFMEMTSHPALSLCVSIIIFTYFVENMIILFNAEDSHLFCIFYWLLKPSASTLWKYLDFFHCDAILCMLEFVLVHVYSYYRYIHVKPSIVAVD